MLWHTYALPTSLSLSRLYAEISPTHSHEEAVASCQGPFHTAAIQRLVQSCWNQKQPVVIRQAFNASKLSQTGVWPTWQDIVHLACATRDEDDEELYADEEEDDDATWFDTNEGNPSFLSLSSTTSGDSARIIRHIPNRLDSFQAELGPFTYQQLHDLVDHDKDSRCWSLLVNDVDRWWNDENLNHHNYPSLADWIDQTFAFLPRWRRDDAQISIAPTGGGIGPHVDSYDVFLIQAAGSREWKIQPNMYMTVQQEMKRLIPDLSVRILDQSTSTTTVPPDNAFVSIHLQEGDVLYLPPRVPHWGISTSDSCMTLSVGCRAPSAQEMVARIAEDVLQADDEVSTRRFSEEPAPSDTAKQTKSTKISQDPSLTSHTRQKMKDMVLDAVHLYLDDESRWDALLGKLITEPKRLSDITTLDDQDEEYLGKWGTSAHSVLMSVQQSTEKNKEAFLQRTPGVSYATSQLSIDGDGGKGFVDRLFAGGVMFEVHNDEQCGNVFHSIERGWPLTHHLLV